jgi:O-antigen ligase
MELGDGPAVRSRAQPWLVWTARLGVLVHAAFVPLSIAGMQIGLAIAIGSLLLLATFTRAWTRSFLDAPALIFCGAAILSIPLAALAGSPPVGWHGATLWRSVLTPIVVLSAIALELPGEARGGARRRAVALLCVWAGAALVASAVAWFQFRTGLDVLHAIGVRDVPKHPPLPPRFAERFAANGLFWGYAIFAQNLTAPLTLAGALALFGGLRRPQRALLGAAAVLATCAVALTFSRVAWAALAAGALVLVILGGKRSPMRTAPVVVALFVAATLGVPDLRTRLLHALSPDANADRQMIWGVCAAVVRDHPVLGVGWGNLHTRVHAYYDRLAPGAGVQAGCHDVFFTLYAEGGALLLSAGVAYWALVLWGFWRRQRTAADSLARAAAAGAFAGAFALLLNGVFHDVMYSSEPMYGLGFALGVAAALTRQAEPATGAAITE